MYDYIWLFLIFSVLGYMAEVAYAAWIEKRFVNRGFLNGPVCPIYGVGVTIVYMILLPFKDDTLSLFIGSVIVTSVLEWVTGFVLEKLFHQKWWDYSNKPYNLNGYICLSFSILWGVACTIVVTLVIPFVLTIVHLIPYRLGIVLQIVFCTVMIADCAVTAAYMYGLNKHLDHLDDISGRIRQSSERLGSNVSEEILELRKLYEKKLPEINIIQKRIISAFPNMTSKNNSDELESVRDKLKNLRKLKKEKKHSA